MTRLCGLLALVLVTPPALLGTTIRTAPPGTAWPVAAGGASLRAAVPAKSLDPGRTLVLPNFEVDTTDPFGSTTLFAVRNEGPTDVEVTVTYHDPLRENSFVEAMTLVPKQTWTRNLRDAVVGELATDLDGFVRGYAVLQGPSGSMLSGDMFLVTPGQDFAGGELLVNVDDDEVCETHRGRFMSGGAFSGGTRLLLFMDAPRGGDAGSDPPSVTGTAYTEAGAAINDFAIWTDEYTLAVDIAGLVTVGNPFGSFDLRFTNVDLGLLGGAVVLQASAEGRYAVTFRSVCIP